MPELPEVETVRQGLLLRVIGREISRLEIRLPKILVEPGLREFKTALKGQSFQNIQRRGKHLIFHTEEYRLLVHLGMTGQLTFWDKTRQNDPGFYVTPHTGLQKARQHAIDRHTHVSIFFADGNAVHYRDIRQFGKWRLLSIQKFNDSGIFSGMGLEPFSSEYRISPFLRGFQGRSLRIKSLLLDQGFVAGVGNIYADEALFEARIHPERNAHQLTSEEKKKLFRAIPHVLKLGLKNGGTTLQNFVNAEGGAGGNQDFLKVYGREGKKCRRCKTRITRVIVSQRSSHFCPHCQPLDR
jgi:formamidopyrimidine-DNA glycosylase